ncbi:MAG: flap endonuclease-1 [Nanoarchaeota archaeon]
MGVKFNNLIKKNEFKIDQLNNKIVVIDTYNILYQFLTTIRQQDGSPLVDSNNNITSHLVGLFSRTVNLLEKNIKLVYVFDGKPPLLKQKEQERRKELKINAQKQYDQAKQIEDISLMNKFAKRTSRLTKEMVDEAKELILAFGLPIVQAPSEGEAQAAHMVKKNDAYAVVSQDYDALLFESPKIIRNLSITKKKKIANSPAYKSIDIELVNLSENLNFLGIDINQLIVIAMLTGTDYNYGGIKGIGPKKALILVKKHKNNFDELFKEIKWDEHFKFSWQDVFYAFKKTKVTDDYSLDFKEINYDKIIEIMCKNHDSSFDRINSQLEKLKKFNNKNQKSLDSFFT